MPRLLLGAALLLIGAGAILVAATSGEEAGAEELVTPASPVNEDARDLRDISANNSPSLSENPTDPENLALSNRIDEAPFGCALHVSFDGGANWEGTRVPFAPGASRECFAPDVAFGADGELYFSYVTLEGDGNVPEAAWVARSANGGRTLTAPVRIAGPLTFQVRLATDPSRPGRVYATYLEAAGVGLFQFASRSNPIQVIRSDDGARSWGEPSTVSAPERERVVAATPAVGAEGQLIVAYVDLGDDLLDYFGEHKGMGGPPYDGDWQLVAARSSDGGETFEESAVEESLAPTERVIVFIPPFPALAVSPSGDRAYVAFQEATDGDPDVVVWGSKDGGESWGDATKVNDTESGDGTTQYRPQLSVAPDGRLDVLYYDRREDDEDVLNEVSFQSSSDEGDSFGERLTLSDRAFDSRIGFGFERELADLGSRLAVLSSDRRALAVWADTRGGAPNFPKQDLARAIVALPEDGNGLAGWLRLLLGVAGAILAATGAAALARPVRSVLRTPRAAGG